jgi:hypothetical protein
MWKRAKYKRITVFFYVAPTYMFDKNGGKTLLTRTLLGFEKIQEI